MRRTLAIMIAMSMLLSAGLIANLGCGATNNGAEIYLEGLSTGPISMDGKAISGLPSQETNVVLKVSATRVSISTTGDETTIRLDPSESSIVIGPDGVSISGVEPDQIEMKWQPAE